METDLNGLSPGPARPSHSGVAGGNGGARNRYGERLAGEAVFAGEFVNMGDWHGGRGRTAGGWEGLGTTTFGFDDFNVL